MLLPSICCCPVYVVAQYMLLPSICCCPVYVVAQYMLLPSICCCLVYVVAQYMLLLSICCVHTKIVFSSSAVIHKKKMSYISSWIEGQSQDRFARIGQPILFQTPAYAYQKAAFARSEVLKLQQKQLNINITSCRGQGLLAEIWSPNYICWP